MTGIEWTDEVWNPVTGCSKISPGCANCYALEMTKRFRNAFPNGFEVTHHNDRLINPKKWKKPRKVFVNSMSDLFHERVDGEFIKQVFEVMKKCPQHTFQILTKRPEDAVKASQNLKLEWSPNIWMGVSVESNRYLDRVKWLCRIPAATRFPSCEPLLGDLGLNEYHLLDIDWVIVGGESGAKHRPIDPDWVRSIRDVCLEEGVAFFFKQWGGKTPKAGGRLLDGVEWSQFPVKS